MLSPGTGLVNCHWLNFCSEPSLAGQCGGRITGPHDLNLIQSLGLNSLLFSDPE